MIAVMVALALALTPAAGVVVVRYLHDDSRRDYLGRSGWPATGQAAYAIGTGRVVASPHEVAQPVASVAKVMTALLVLRDAPLHGDDDGFAMTVTPADVDDTRVRAARDESVVPVSAGEVLSERQALAALLLPSANNVAIMLARRIGGSVRAFVTRMNVAAQALGMRHTRYTDPSGFDDRTVSTAADQTLLAEAAMRVGTFAAMVALPSYELPVAGTVHNTDVLLGTHGFVGIKTGSDDAAGGCFMFRAYRSIGGRSVAITGVVLGQPGYDLVLTGQYAAAQLVDRLAPDS